MDWDNRTQTGARASGVEETTPRMAVHQRAHCSDTVRNAKRDSGVHERQTQTYVLPRVCLVLASSERHEGRRYLKGQPSSRTGENPPYGMIGEVVETSASFEARFRATTLPDQLKTDARSNAGHGD
jgi:hypothetical protein